MTHEETRDRIRETFTRWRPLLGLHEWDVKLDYTNGSFVNQDGHATGPNTMATTYTRWQYRHASLHFNTAVMATEDPWHFEAAVVHEMVHVLLNEMRDLCQEDDHQIAIKHEERVCQSLAWAFMRTAGIDPPPLGAEAGAGD